jgi:uncharacterized protein (TIGR03067 family)
MLRGAWRIVTEVSCGDLNPDAADNGYWFHPDRVVIGSRDCAWEWPIRVDAGASPATIDMWSDDPEYPFQDRGIWELAGRRLRLCWGVRDSGTRPTGFASTPENGWQLLEMEPSQEPEPA